MFETSIRDMLLLLVTTSHIPLLVMAKLSNAAGFFNVVYYFFQAHAKAKQEGPTIKNFIY